MPGQPDPLRATKRALSPPTITQVGGGDPQAGGSARDTAAHLLTGASWTTSAVTPSGEVASHAVRAVREELERAGLAISMEQSSASA